MFSQHPSDSVIIISFNRVIVSHYTGVCVHPLYICIMETVDMYFKNKLKYITLWMCHNNP